MYVAIFLIISIALIPTMNNRETILKIEAIQKEYTAKVAALENQRNQEIKKMRREIDNRQIEKLQKSIT